MTKDRHISAKAKNTSVRLTREDKEAVHEIAKAREANHDKRTRLNDILVDALWHFLKHTTGKTEADIKSQLPPELPIEAQKNNVTPIKKP